jgi:hypothetical protein
MQGVITMAMIGKVRRMHRRDKKSVREIAKATSLSRNTVRKYLRMEQVEEPKYRREAAPTKLAPFHEAVTQALAADARRPKRERRTARALHEQLKAAGYDGGYSRLTDFIRAWRASVGQAASTTAFVPLAFELGEAFQFDWSDEGVVIAGVYRRVQLAHMKLCASRAFWLVAYPSQGHEMLFDAHARGFAALGIARRGIYDNMKTAVDKVNKGRGRVVNTRFAVMCAHYLIDADFCNVASGWEKGIVEKNVQDSRRRVWLEATRRRWGSFEELNAWLASRCRELWQQLRHPEHEAFSIAEMHEHERAHLLPMSVPFDGYVEKPARVSSTCLVSVAKNRYSVPCEHAGHTVSTRLYPRRVSARALAATAPRAAARTWRRPRDGAGAGAGARHRARCGAGGSGTGAGERAAVRTRERGARAERAGALECRTAAGQRRHGAEGEHAAAGRHRALRPPAQRRRARGGRPCVNTSPNSKGCACTAWPAPGPSWPSKAAMLRWSPRAGYSNTCWMPSSPTARCARSATR